MRTLLLLGLVACRKDPNDFKPDESGIFETGLDTETGTPGDDTAPRDDTAPPDTAPPDDTAPPEDVDGDGFTVDQGDCDDLDVAVHPGADERCDGLDQDCDGIVDEGVTGTFYADTDGDGHGDPATATEACEGAVETDDDCDDTRADVYPGATEACDGADNDCDDAIDEEGLTLWYDDLDADGYGDVTTAAYDCSADGRVSNAEDCDDTDAGVSPAGIESCNLVDDDCDGTVDEGVTDTWYIDYDSDGYGSDSYTRSGCTAPSGYVDNADDCDDTESDVNPGATELCNEVDDDCDGTVDEDDAADATTWYVDVDGDTWGDTSVYQFACEQPSSFVPDDGDCDDLDASVYPGAPERYDGLDNDCDGSVDDNTWIGTGADGALDVTGVTDLSTDASNGRTEPDGVSWPVVALGTDTITVDGTLDGLAAGDEVLLINLQGSASAYSSVGAYEFGWVASASGSTITLDAALSSTYGEVDNTDLTDQVIVVVRVPQYTDVTVDSAGLLTTSAWDGETGGVLAFRATGTVTVVSGGAVAVDELGYAGGPTGTASDMDAFQGESYAGIGIGGDFGYEGYNDDNGAAYANFGGGGVCVTGAGGNYAGGATDADSWTGGSAPIPEAGDTYGDATLATLFLGSGGGGVWRGSSYPGPGGSGAGILYVGASAVTADGGAAFTAIGGTTPYWATGTWTYGAGGGAGGSVWIVADTLTLASGAIDAQGGLGESTHIRAGGDGGYGRVRVECNVVNGQGCGTSASATELATAAEPDVGYEATP